MFNRTLSYCLITIIFTMVNAVSALAQENLDISQLYLGTKLADGRREHLVVQSLSIDLSKVDPIVLQIANENRMRPFPLSLLFSDGKFISVINFYKIGMDLEEKLRTDQK